MKSTLLLVAVSLALTACSEEKPAPVVVHETRVVHHYHTVDRPSTKASDNPDDFEPVERPATYSH